MTNEHKEGWGIDLTTGTPILTFDGCSVIQDEQAYFVMGLLGWQPIETAPKDGSIVVLWRPQPDNGCNACSRVIGKWSDEESKWIWPCNDCTDIEFSDEPWQYEGEYYMSDEFTHWMPCCSPKPPCG